MQYGTLMPTLGLFGVMVCETKIDAMAVERESHARLSAFRQKGEWFEYDPEAAWGIITRGIDLPTYWLMGYLIDIDTLTLRVPPKGAFPAGSCSALDGGIDDPWHFYLEAKAKCAVLAPA